MTREMLVSRGFRSVLTSSLDLRQRTARQRPDVAKRLGTINAICFEFNIRGSFGTNTNSSTGPYSAPHQPVYEPDGTRRFNRGSRAPTLLGA